MRDYSFWGQVFVVGFFLGPAVWVGAAMGGQESQVQALIEKGEFAKAEAALAREIDDLEAPVTEPAAIEREILRRIRHDFSLTAAEVLAEIQKSIPDATLEDVERWYAEGDLQGRVIDGEVKYFRRAVGTLFRFSDDAKQRRAAAGQHKPGEDNFNLPGELQQLVELAEKSDDPEVSPIHHRVKYGVTIAGDHPRVKQGAWVRVWLPFPQEYRQQRDVKLLSATPKPTLVAENGVPHRTVYFEQTVEDADKPQQFEVEYEFVTSAYCPKLDPALVEEYDTTSVVYREHTAERAPHIVFTPEVRSLTAEIVGDETNPLEKARRIFRWVSANVPWCAEMEYSTIRNLSAKGLAARRGDCGVQGLTFVTLCRAAGVPARWQSGWQTKPGDWNMHDWSEMYIEPWGWLPVDASYGMQQHEDPRVQEFLCGRMDPYRLIVNLDYGRELSPPKTSFRSEPNDFQRGEVEIDGHNLYFDEWRWSFNFEVEPAGATK